MNQWDALQSDEDQLEFSIICVGNDYQLDDGFGPAVARDLLARYGFPENVQVLDRAIMGYDIIPDLRECNVAVAVDALDGTGHAPGTVLAFDPEDMATSAEIMSLHQVRFADVLAAGRMMGARCAVGRCFGVQVEDMGTGTLQQGLSVPVEAAVAVTADAVVAYLSSTFGLTIHRR